MFWAVCISVLVQIAPVFAQELNQEIKNERVRFSSVYTDLSKDCSWAFNDEELQEGQDNALNCIGFGGYTGFIYFSAMGIHFTLKDSPESQQYALVPAVSLKDFRKGMVEWRLANGIPFAIIACGPKRYGSEGPEGEILFVRGMGDYSAIDSQVDLSKHRNAIKKARKLADTGYPASNKPLRPANPARGGRSD